MQVISTIAECWLRSMHLPCCALDSRSKRKVANIPLECLRNIPGESAGHRWGRGAHFRDVVCVGLPVPKCRLDLLISKIGYRAKAKRHRVCKLGETYRNDRFENLLVVESEFAQRVNIGSIDFRPLKI